MVYREWERNDSEEWKIFLDQHPNCRDLAERYQKYYWKIWNLRIIDDDFMRKILADKTCLQLVLRIIMEKPDLEIVEVNVQFDMKNLQGRSLELDVLAVDGRGGIYDIEVQRDDQKASPKRARYHSALIDANTLNPGEDFNNLFQNYVIFITENDVIGKGLPIYHVERIIQETGGMFGDGTHILYVNANIQDDTELGKLMHDFMCPNPDQMHYSILARQTRYYKETEKGVTSMCRIFEEVKEEGRAEGREEGREESRKIVSQELLNLLYEYGEIPTQWKEKIEGEDDLLQLSLWFRRAAQVQTLEEFELS